MVERSQFMQVVCVSYNAPPLNDAEALCTARLLSALVSFGVEVHLIANQCCPSLEASIAAEVLDSRIQITRVPVCRGLTHRVMGMARYHHHTEHAGWIFPAIAATKRVLRECINPILLTRAFPIVSNIVGYYCSSESKAWVAHFSDPYPPHEWKTHCYSPIIRPLNRRWAQGILKSADLVTVTCRNATRYIQERSAFRFSEKSMVVTHLALPELKAGNFKLDRRPDEFVVAHIGNLMRRRRPDLLFPGALLAMQKHPQIRFLQYGHVDREILAQYTTNPVFSRLDIRHVDNLSPRDAADCQKQVDVNVIIDTDLNLAYSPFLLSKYAHALCAGKPLLMLSNKDSEMSRLTKKYGGGELVPFSNPEAVADAICRLFANRNGYSNLQRLSAYRQAFSPEVIIRPFIEKLESL